VSYLIAQGNIKITIIIDIHGGIEKLAYRDARDEKTESITPLWRKYAAMAGAVAYLCRFTI